jgi:hypothetical protein
MMCVLLEEFVVVSRSVQIPILDDWTWLVFLTSTAETPPREEILE